MIQKSGADYAYIHFAFGPFLAFIRMWIECIILRPCIGAIQVGHFPSSIDPIQLLAEPHLRSLHPEAFLPRVRASLRLCEDPGRGLSLPPLLHQLLQCQVGRHGKRGRGTPHVSSVWLQVQDYFTYAKMFALILISITGVVQLGHGKTEFFTFENSETDVSVIALSFYSGLFSYTGWNYLNFIIEEMKVRLMTMLGFIDDFMT